jgi:hypothetical protein
MNPEELAAQAEAQASASAVAPQTVPMVGVDGRVYDATPEQAQAMLDARSSSGAQLFHPETPDEAAARQARIDYGGIGGQVASTVAGFTAGIPGLASTIAQSADLAHELTDTPATNYYRDLRSANPNAFFGGEMAGAVLPALLTAGESLAANVAERGALGIAGRTLAAPGLIVENLGTAAEGLAARQFAAGSIRQALARGVAGGATEGALGGLQNALNEDAFGNRPLTVESLLTDVGMGALLGGATGGLLYGGGATLRNGALRLSRPVREAVGDVASRAWRASQGFDLEEGVADLYEAANNQMARASSLITGGNEDFIRTIGNARSAAGQRIRRDVLSLGQPDQDIFERATRQILRDVDAAEGVSQEVLEGWAVKRGLIEEQVSDARVLDQVNLARRVAQEASDMSRAVVDDVRLYEGGQGIAARRIQGHADAVREMIDRSAASGAPTRQIAADMFEAMDQLKRRIGREIGPLPPNSALRRDMQTFYDDAIRVPLEDEGMWGRIANTQRDVNEAYTNHLTWRNNFRRAFLAEGDRDPASAWRRVMEMNSSPTDAFVRSAGTAANDTRERVFRESLAAHAELLDRMADNTGMDIEKAARARAGAAAARQAITNFDEILGRVKAVNQFRALESGTGVERALAAQAVGFFAGGPLGVVAATALANPAMRARALGAIERAAARTKGRLREGVGSYIRKSIDASREAIENRLAPAARRGAVQARSAAERARVATRRLTSMVALSEYEKTAAEAQERAQDPLALMRRLEAQTEDMHEVAPQTRNEMVQLGVRGAQFLATKVPRESAPLGSALPTIARRLPPSVPDRARFLRYARAVYTPLTIVDDLETGQLTPESVEVMRTLYPEMHAWMVQSAQEALIEHARADDVLPYSTRLALGSLMGFESDASLTPRSIALTQAAILSQPQQQNAPSPTRAPTRSQSSALSALTQGTPLQSQRAESRR